MFMQMKLFILSMVQVAEYRADIVGLLTLAVGQGGGWLGV